VTDEPTDEQLAADYEVMQSTYKVGAKYGRNPEWVQYRLHHHGVTLRSNRGHPQSWSHPWNAGIGKNRGRPLEPK